MPRRILVPVLAVVLIAAAGWYWRRDSGPTYYTGFVEGFSHDLETVSVADICEYAQTLFTKPLKRVRRSPRFVSAATEKSRPTASDRFSNCKRLGATLNRTWTSNDRQLIPANRCVATHAHDRLFRSEIKCDQFVGLTDTNRFRNAREIFEVGRINGPLIASDANGCASCARHRVAFET